MEVMVTLTHGGYGHLNTWRLWSP